MTGGESAEESLSPNTRSLKVSSGDDAEGRGVEEGQEVVQVTQLCT